MGQHVGDFFGPAGIIPTLLALAAGGEISGGVVVGSVNDLLVSWFLIVGDLRYARDKFAIGR